MRIYLFPFPWFLFEKRIQYLPHFGGRTLQNSNFIFICINSCLFAAALSPGIGLFFWLWMTFSETPQKKFLIFVNHEFWGRSVQEICKKSRKLGMDSVRTSLSSNISLNGNCYILFLGAGRTGGQCLIRMITPFRLKSWIKSLKQMPGFVGRQPPQAFQGS